MTSLAMRSFCLAVLAGWNLSLSAAEDKLLPFTLASRQPAELASVADATRSVLGGAGFRVLGEYRPYEHALILVITRQDLLQASAASEMGGFGAYLRLSLNQVGDEVQVAYVNPVYLAAAYRLQSDYAALSGELRQLLGHQQDFGSKGLTARQLAKYHYMFGMERFDDPWVLADYPSHAEALAAVRRNLQDNTVGLGEVFQVSIPGKEEVVFGVSMTAPRDDYEEGKLMDDAYQMQIVDVGELRQNAYLPYALMVSGKRVLALHMRFRMAVHFPGLSMMGEHSFMKLRPSPKKIEQVLRVVAGG